MRYTQEDQCSNCGSLTPNADGYCSICEKHKEQPTPLTEKLIAKCKPNADEIRNTKKIVCEVDWHYGLIDKTSGKEFDKKGRFIGKEVLEFYGIVFGNVRYAGRPIYDTFLKPFELGKFYEVKNGESMYLIENYRGKNYYHKSLEYMFNSICRTLKDKAKEINSPDRIDVHKTLTHDGDVIEKGYLQQNFVIPKGFHLVTLGDNISLGCPSSYKGTTQIDLVIDMRFLIQFFDDSPRNEECWDKYIFGGSPNWGVYYF